MARDYKPPRDPEKKNSGGRRLKGTGSGLQREPQHGSAWLPQRGRSGYGIESIRPHLRAQLEERKLWRVEFPPRYDNDDEEEGPID